MARRTTVARPITVTVRSKSSGSPVVSLFRPLLSASVASAMTDPDVTQSVAAVDLSAVSARSRSAIIPSSRKHAQAV